MWLLAVLLVEAVSACQLVAVDLCRTAGYNYTSMPNLVGHETQADADFTLQTFSPLVQYGCSAQLSFFLCSVYVPMCNEKVAVPIGPCRGLCENVKARCYPVLQGFGFPWPAALDCAKFPAQNDHLHMCMEGPGEVRAAAPAVTLPPDTTLCSQYARPGMYLRVNHTGHCLQLCDADVLFTRADKDVTEYWISVLSAVCFVTSMLAVLTFLTDSDSRGCRFPYPDRPLPFLALCYNVVSVGWGVRAVLGREPVACYPDPHTHSHTLLLAQEGLGNAHCALVFFLTYFFGNAIAIWWFVVMTCWFFSLGLGWTHDRILPRAPVIHFLSRAGWIVVMTCWFFSLGLGWTHDRILPHAPVFHLLSWGVSSCLTITVLILRYVDADELTGICSVGNHHTEALLGLVIVPQFVCLVLGLSMLLLTIVSHSQTPWGHHRVLLTILYLLSSAASLGANCYQYFYYDHWVLALGPSPSPRAQPHAPFWLFLLRPYATLTVGTLISIWICLPKSAKNWRTVVCPTDSYKKPTLAPVKYHQNNYYYYKQPEIYRGHRKSRKHKDKKGNETLV